MLPDDRKYSKSHEWVKIDGDLAVVGITDHAQGELGDITFIELDEVGEAKQAGDQCGEIESVKAASEVYAPVAGEIAEINLELENNPQLVNQSPFEQGWLFKLRQFESAGMSQLMDAADYQEWLKEDE